MKSLFFSVSFFCFSSALFASGVELELPKGISEKFSVQVPFDGEVLTLDLKKNSVIGESTRFLVADGSASLKEVDSGIQGAFLGTVQKRPDYTVSAVLTKDGLLATIVRPGKDTITVMPDWDKSGNQKHWVGVDEMPHEGECVCHGGCPCEGEHVEEELPFTGEVISTPYQSVPIGAVIGRVNAKAAGATLPPSRVMDVLEYEVGVEIGSRAFIDNYGSNLASAQAAAASVATNMDARYLRGSGIKHVLGTVLIRTNAATDPLRNTVTGNNTGSLEAFRNFWNGNPGVVGTTHDIAVYHVRSSPSGLAWVNSVGSSNRYALSCSNGPTSWANGTLVHEFGHSWSLRHTGDAPINEYDFDGGGDAPSSFYESKPRSSGSAAGGDHTFVSVMHGGGDHNIGRLSTDEANMSYSARQNKRSFGVVVNPGQVPPFGHRDAAFTTADSAVLIDVIANDFDANNDVLNVRLKDSMSHLGGTVALSSGTGPGGRDELLYTPPANPSGGTDFFHYTVCDPSGGTDFGAVYVTIGQELLFAESFIYPAGNLDGESNAGLAWDDQVGGGSTTVVTSEKLLEDDPSGLRSAGGKVRQVGSDRFALILPGRAAGGDDGTVRYISFVQKLSFADVGRSQILEFWNGSPSGANTAFSFGTDTNGDAPDYGLLIDKDGAGIPLPLGSPDDEAHLVVLKVEYGASDADRISVFLDPGMTEPVTADASSDFTNLAFNRIGFGSFQGGGQELDEIRIGTTYESVVPQEEPELFFEESFDHAVGSLAGKSVEGNVWVDESGGGSSLVSAENRLVQTASDRLSLPLGSDSSGGVDHTTRFISFVQKFATSDVNKTKIVEFWKGDAVDTNTAFSFGTDTNGAAPDYGLFVDKNGGDIALDLGTADANEHLVVLKVEYGTDTDGISVYVDPGSDEPSAPDAMAFYSDLSFDRLGFGSFQGGAQEVDEIRIGASFQDVVPVSNPDSDGDGLPDDFEWTYYDSSDLSVTDGSDDLDGDGMSDGAEFVAGTDPTDRNSLLRIMELGLVTPTEVSITWQSVTGIDYSIWASDDLTLASWVRVVPSVIANGAETTVDVPRSGPREFFIIVVNP